MQGGVGYGYAADKHRRQAGDGGNGAGAADLHVDAFHGGQRFFGGEFVGDRPARAAVAKAQNLLLRQAVYFYHHAVDFVGQVRPLLRHRFVKGERAGNIGADAPVAFGQAETEFGQPFELLRVAFRLPGRAFKTGDAVGEKVQLALGGDARIELAQAAGGGVARVGKRLLPRRFLAFVQRGEIGFEHQHFAAHFDQRRHVFSGQLQRDIAHGFDVFADVFARGAVAARGRLHEHAVAIE